MECVANALAVEFSPIAYYTQSDEITLLFEQESVKTQMLFGGNVNKIVSLTAASATLGFYRLGKIIFGGKKARKINFNLKPAFDSRVFQTPNRTEASNCLLWRWQDATRNSIQQVGQNYFSHKELHGVNTSQIIEKLWLEKNVDFFAYNPVLRNGYFVSRKLAMHLTPNLYEFDFAKATNREDVLFNAAEPIYDEANLPKLARKEYI